MDTELDKHSKLITSDLIATDQFTPIAIGGDTYPIFITDNHIQIDCEIHTFDEWKAFSDQEIIVMDGRKALSFWRKWKPIIFQIIENRV